MVCLWYLLNGGNLDWNLGRGVVVVVVVNG